MPGPVKRSKVGPEIKMPHLKAFIIPRRCLQLGMWRSSLLLLQEVLQAMHTSAVIQNFLNGSRWCFCFLYSWLPSLDSWRYYSPKGSCEQNERKWKILSGWKFLQPAILDKTWLLFLFQWKWECFVNVETKGSRTLSCALEPEASTSLITQL